MKVSCTGVVKPIHSSKAKRAIVPAIVNGAPYEDTVAHKRRHEDVNGYLLRYGVLTDWTTRDASHPDI
jgi:hypothetical protein